MPPASSRPPCALARLQASDPEEQNLLTVSRALVHAASERRESRGTHTRSDYPEPSPEFLGRFVFAGDDDPDFVPLVGVPEPAP